MSTSQLENTIQDNSTITVIPGLIETILGTTQRYWTKDNEYSSTLALKAIDKLIKQDPNILNNVDLVIYASTTQDCIEPSTACIVMKELGLTCASFDIQNACNSIMSALSIAHQYIISNTYHKVLICSGETPSKSIKIKHHDQDSFKQSFSSFGLGDCGIAMMIEGCNDGGFLHIQSLTKPDLREETTILGGGSRHPRESDHCYFIGNPSGLKPFFLGVGVDLIYQSLDKIGRSIELIDHILIHQVSHDSYFTALEALKVDEAQLCKTYDFYGNVASCTVPLQLCITGLHSGHKYLFVGLGAGATIRCLLYQH